MERNGPTKSNKVVQYETMAANKNGTQTKAINVKPVLCVMK